MRSKELPTALLIKLLYAYFVVLPRDGVAVARYATHNLWGLPPVERSAIGPASWLTCHYHQLVTKNFQPLSSGVVIPRNDGLS